MIGRTIAHYKITEKIGAGGMGEVFRAADSKLGRDVALKMLPAAFAQDAERMARFQREAKVLASLNHPNIAAIYGLEESDDSHFLVLELIEGPTLFDRLGRGPLPQGEALEIARQIATALEFAHENGVVHRDLKPSNVKVMEDGRVKVLDFGLAKAIQDPAEAASSGAGEPPVSPTASPSQFPTLQSPITGPLTAANVILGTAAYMSPEQARGKPIDRRTDIWSFGCVLYECLTGKLAFAGDTVTDTIARILEREPDWVALPSGVSPRLRRLLERCLAKDPSRRFRHIGDVLMELDDIASGVPDPVAAGGGQALLSRRMFAVVGAGVLIGAVVTALGLGLGGGAKPDPGPVTRLTMTLPPDAQPNTDSGVSMAWTPDGRGIAYQGSRNGQTWIFRRNLDAEAPAPIPGTQGGSFPFFSPDGKWLAFTGRDAVFKVPVDGGTPIKIHPGSAEWGAVWARDGAIIAPLSLNGGLMRFSEGGGEATALTRPAEGELGHWWPTLLPDGKHALFTCWRTTIDDASIQVIPAAGGEPRELVPNAAFARYAASGHLIFSRGTSLMAVPFDPVRVEIQGSPVVVQDSVLIRNEDGATMAVFWEDGTLVYYPALGSSRWLAWVEPGPDPAHPVVRPVTEARKNYGEISVSPDGRHVALDIVTGTEVDIWVLDTQRGTQTRITLNGKSENPVWTPDGRMITYSSLRRGPYEIYQTAADGSGGERLLYGIPQQDIHPESWSPEGRLAFRRAGDTQSDIMVLDPLGKDGKPQAENYVATDADERSPAFSPDGKWMLYQSRVSGRTEVYLQSYPPSGGRLQVSVSGGSFPLWASDGTAVFYRHASRLYRVPVALRPQPEIGDPAPLIDEARLPGTVAYYAIHPDGKRFLMILDSRETRPLRVVQNWFQEVERLAGKGL